MRTTIARPQSTLAIAGTFQRYDSEMPLVAKNSDITFLWMISIKTIIVGCITTTSQRYPKSSSTLLLQSKVQHHYSTSSNGFLCNPIMQRSHPFHHPPISNLPDCQDHSLGSERLIVPSSTVIFANQQVAVVIFRNINNRCPTLVHDCQITNKSQTSISRS